MALYFGNQLVSLTSINSGRGIDTSERTAVQLQPNSVIIRSKVNPFYHYMNIAR